VNRPGSHDAVQVDALDRRLWLSAGLNVVITLAELAGGLLSGSLALMSDAAHNFSDVVAVGLALWARRLGRRPPTTRHTYGFKRAEVIAALVNAVALIGVGLFIAREALGRLLHPTAVVQGLMLAVALGALVANIGAVLLLRRHDADDVNVRGAFLHMAQDALASLAVVAAALLAHTAVGPWVDPAAALIVVFAVVRSAVALIWETLSTLLEGAPAGIDVRALQDDVTRAFPGVTLHHLHLWRNGPGQRLLTAHVAVAADLDARRIETLFNGIKSVLHEHWEISHATLEPEVSGCGEETLLGRWERTRTTPE
jgi:cobalt-zinc-cadmium efflux system protein